MFQSFLQSLSPAGRAKLLARSRAATASGAMPRAAGDAGGAAVAVDLRAQAVVLTSDNALLLEELAQQCCDGEMLEKQVLLP